MTRLFVIILVIFSFFSFSPAFAGGKKISKIVLDAGHGGNEPGARGAFSNEKDITLSVVLKLGKIISDSMKEVKVIFTRTTDSYPTLIERHEIANKANGDLFLSVHVNSTPFTYTKVLEGYKMVKKGKKKVKVPVYRKIKHHVTKANGVETWVMGIHRNGQKEEAIGEYGDNISEEPGLLNENDPMTAIIIHQYAQAFLSRSVALASKIQQSFNLQGRHDLGVKQKGLEVLAGSAMPGCLVEIGFITNTDEETYLNSEQGQWEVAMAIFRGIKSYKLDVEK
jgi:N-acetylmuramoyl-L-alanine amidase